MKELRKYQSTYFVRFIGDAFFYPFYALYLASLNIPNSKIGWILMLLPMVALFINPIWSKVARNINDNRNIMRILTLIEAVVVLTIIQTESVPFIIMLTIMLAIVGQPVYILLDSFTTVFTNKHGYSYSGIRLFGSLAYGIAIMIAGFIIKQFGYTQAFLVSSLFFVLFAVMLSWLLPLDIESDVHLNQKSDYKVLIKNKSYIKFALFYIISFGALFGGDNYLSIYFQSLSVTPDQYGFIVFGFAFIEIFVLIFFSKFGDKFSTRNILIVATLTSVLRFLVYSMDLPLWAYITISMIRSVTMGSLLYITMRYVAEITLPKNLTLGILIFSSFRSLYTALLTIAGGYITDYLGYHVFYIVVAVLALTAFGFIDYRKQTNRDMV